MIGRGNYALSFRRHKRQKSRFQCDGKCTKVGIARLTATSGRTLLRPNRKVPTTVSWHLGRACRSRRIGRQVRTNMTIGHLTPLTELERDALGEVSNIAMARAANSLRQMVEHEVLLSVPAVEILSQDQATQLVAKPDNPNLVAVRQDFSGAFAG